MAIKITGLQSTGNGGHGVHIRNASTPVEIDGMVTADNAGDGLKVGKVSDSSEADGAKNRYEKPIGKIAIGVAIMIIGTAILWAFGQIF